MTNRRKRARARRGAVTGVKALISITALAATLAGWGLLGEAQATVPGASSGTPSRSVAAAELLRSLPTLAPRGASGSSDGTNAGSASRAALRSVNPPPVSARPVPITRTQSSR